MQFITFLRVAPRDDAIVFNLVVQRHKAIIDYVNNYTELSLTSSHVAEVLEL